MTEYNYGNSKDMFREIGIVDTRLYSMRRAMEELHTALAFADPDQRAIFTTWFDSHNGVRDAVNQWAKHEEGLNASL
jgi:hypothetical protein